ncbi:MAG TPA: ATP-binding cassette domain-containing protein [Bacteroidetes bacterium]|nr:cell division ATP-binding protein FtsE [bacterium BMS3Bbin04]HDO65596.1 ATP-binding cassette domain-containing protein [Bacteroidota bacterium]HEX04721.1 ATP-binding cassette domain-containing protein [Bacteroidota bacterium]
MIELMQVSKQYSRGRGVHDVSFRISKGEWVLLVGDSGAGKSTILRMIYGAVRPDSGDLIVASKRLSQVNDNSLPSLRREMGIIDQDLTLVDDRSVYRNVSLVGEVHGWSKKKTKQQSLRVLNRVGLHAHLDQLPTKLSRGELRRLAIARALVAQPFVLIADEPLIHLDTETAGSIIELLEKIHAQGTSILLATHRSELFDGYPVRRLLIEDGEVREES